MKLFLLIITLTATTTTPLLLSLHRVCAGEKIFAEFACMFSCLLCLLVYYFIGQPVLTLVMVGSFTAAVLRDC